MTGTHQNRSNPATYWLSNQARGQLPHDGHTDLGRVHRATQVFRQRADRDAERFAQLSLRILIGDQCLFQ